jgi:hypothetical protein
VTVTGFCGGYYSAIGNFFSANSSTSQSLAANTTLIFNNIVNASSCISYNTTSGVGTILVPGSYLFEWRCSLNPYTSGSFEIGLNLPQNTNRVNLGPFVNVNYVFASTVTTVGSAVFQMAAGNTFNLATPSQFNTQTLLNASSGTRISATLLGNGLAASYGNVAGVLQQVPSMTGVYGCANGYSISGTQTTFLYSVNVITSPYMTLNTSTGGIIANYTGWYYMSVYQQSSTYSSGSPSLASYIKVAGNTVVQGTSISTSGAASGNNILVPIRAFAFATAGQAITFNATTSGGGIAFLNQSSSGACTTVTFLGEQPAPLTGLLGGVPCIGSPLCTVICTSNISYATTGSPSANVILQSQTTSSPAMSYSTSTGYFTANLSGVFVFNVAIAVSTSSLPGTQLQIFVNGSFYARGPSQSSSTGYGTSSNVTFVDTISLLLSVGSTVSFRLATNSNFTVTVLSSVSNGSTLYQAYYLGGSN